MATIRPNEINMTTTPTLSSRPLPAPALPTLKTTQKPTAPRIDLEPLYVAVKSSISPDNWTLYKSSISAFLLGQLNQFELSSRLDRILTSPALEHAHNQFVIAILGNVLRDQPEAGTASWADDKVVGGTGKGGGVGGGKGSGAGQEGEVEKRLKSEVMALARRERKRLKSVQDSPFDKFATMMQEVVEGKRIRIPDTGPASAGGFQKTNWDLEIRKHYTTPLFTETHEFPDPTTISTRMLPICYELGLPSGHHPDCSAYMNIATETYIKEALATFFARVSSNGPSYIRTADFKRKVLREEGRVSRGEIRRTEAGLLPVEVEEQRRRKPLGMEDLRLALQLGDSYLGQTPIIAGTIVNARFLDAPGVEDLEVNFNADTAISSVAIAKPIIANGAINGVNGVVVVDHSRTNGYANANANANANGWTVDLNDPMPLQPIDEEFGWLGGSVQDVEGLDAVLDQCLAVGV